MMVLIKRMEISPTIELSQRLVPIHHRIIIPAVITTAYSYQLLSC